MRQLHLIQTGHLILILFSMLQRFSLAAITNRTIDDTKGDSVTGQSVSYMPSSGGVWNGVECPSCAVRPDPMQAFSGTWSEATYFKQTKDPINATMTFIGTAVWVFFILANSAVPGVTLKTVANITLDNQAPRLFEHIPDPSAPQLEYNALAFSQTSLENMQHSLVISVSGLQEFIYINFDYVIYTHEDVVTSSPISSPIIPPSTPAQNIPEPASTKIPVDADPATQTPAISLSSTISRLQDQSSTPGSVVSTSLPAGPLFTSAPFDPSKTSGLPQITNIVLPAGDGGSKTGGSPAGTIGGAVAGGVVVIILILTARSLLRRCRGKSHQTTWTLGFLGDEITNPALSANRRGIRNATTVIPFQISPYPVAGSSDSTRALYEDVQPSKERLARTLIDERPPDYHAVAAHP